MIIRYLDPWGKDHRTWGLGIQAAGAGLRTEGLSLAFSGCPVDIPLTGI